MRLLVDTHLLLWAADEVEKLSEAATAVLTDPENALVFSAVNLWEIMVKRALKTPDFQVDPRRLRASLLTNGYAEIEMTSEHAFELERLPPIHKDPFDRILIAQAMAEGLTLLTSDGVIARYPGPILRV